MTVTPEDLRDHGPDRNGAVKHLGKGKIALPAVPQLENRTAQCAWLTLVFNLDPAFPVTGAFMLGQRGPNGLVVVTRAGAPDISFEPASAINSPTKVIELLSWQLMPNDGAVLALTSEHCREISYVLRMLCAVAEARTHAEEADAIVSTYTQGATAVEGFTTYGTSPQRYEASMALRREVIDGNGRLGAPRYLIDENTGELVIAVSDLQEAARRHEGSSLPRGWVDARMTALGWLRIALDGHGASGRAGRSGPHSRTLAYRGHRLGIEDDEVVTT